MKNLVDKLGMEYHIMGRYIRLQRKVTVLPKRKNGKKSLQVIVLWGYL